MNVWLRTLPISIFLITAPEIWAKNLVPNASFELGVANGWTAWEVAEGAGPYVTAATSVHGCTSLMVALDRESPGPNVPGGYWRHKVRYAPLWLNPGRPYTVSAYGKVNVPDAGLRVRVWDNSGRRAAEGYMVKQADRRIEIGRKWQRIEARFVAGEMRPHLLQIEIDARTPATGWLDAVQVEEGEEATTFTVRDSVEVGFTAAAPGRVFVRGEPIVLRLDAFNDTRNEEQLEAELVLVDIWGRQVWRQLISCPMAPGASRRIIEPILPRSSAQGTFRAELVGTRDDAFLAQIVFSVIPDISKLESLPAAMAGMGTHPPGFDAGALAVEKRLGNRWLRLWSRWRYTAWNFVQPQSDRWQWMDESISRSSQMGFEILGVLGGSPFVVGKHGIPQWAQVKRQNPGYSYSASDYVRYVKRTVAHYKQWIKYWEVWNEPDKPWMITDAPDYGESLILTAKAVKEADPHAKIVGPCIHANRRSHKVSMDDWLDRALIKTGAMKHIDVFSLHYIHDLVDDVGVLDRMNMYDFWADKDGRDRDIWNTEEHSRVIALPFWRGAGDQPDHLVRLGKWRRSWVSRLLPAVEAARDLAILYITHRSVSPGPLFFFTAGTAIYDSGRLSGIGPASPRSTALTVANYLLTPFVNGGKHFFVNWARGFVFERPGESVVVVWADPHKVRVSVRFAIKLPANAEVLDLMGNSVRPPIDLDSGPTYIRIPGKSTSQVEALLANARAVVQ